MNHKGLLFIPDISGFTKFVNKVDIEHGRMILQELLEILINSNQMGLEISEIEGDAILFYKFGNTPDLKEIYKQVEKMFREFHKHLMSYDHLKYCQCTACKSVIDLSLKIITHYGEFTNYNVKNFNKLIGKDVIIAHQLLKNNIDQHEYWLVTTNLLQNQKPIGFTQWMEWDSSSKQTELGEVLFHFTQLSQLRSEIDPEPPLQLEILNRKKVISIVKQFNTDIISLFHLTGDFNNKARWLEGVKFVEEVDHYLPRIGMKCRCVMENEQELIYSSSYSNYGDRIEFSETDEKKLSATYYTLERITDKKTMLTLDFFVKRNLMIQLFFTLIEKKKIEAILIKSLENLEKLIEEFNLPSNE